MRKRFIVAIDSSTKEQNDSFVRFLGECRLGWWHWISNFWLITDPTGNQSASIISDKLEEIYSHINYLVIELSAGGDTWSGFGPATDDTDMFEWLHNTWGKYR